MTDVGTDVVGAWIVVGVVGAGFTPSVGSGAAGVGGGVGVVGAVVGAGGGGGGGGDGDGPKNLSWNSFSQSDRRR